MNFKEDSVEWAKSLFNKCELGDVRLTRRLIMYSARQSSTPSLSTNAVCGGDEIFREGAYRLLRNRKVRAESIAEAGFAAVAESCLQHEVFLCIQDTTSASFSHSVKNELGEIADKRSKNRGFLAHTTLAVSAKSGEIIGLLDQERWMRQKNRHGRDKRKTIPYARKESFKWESCARRVSERLKNPHASITVCDREADVFQFLQYHMESNLRFVIRACYDRRISSQAKHLREHLEQQPVIGTYEISIGQRGPMMGGKHHAKRSGRKARKALLEIRTATVELMPTRRTQSNTPLRVNVILVREDASSVASGAKPLEWMLLTTESVETAEQAQTIVGYYEKRWLIEEFHKAWKTGCRLEKRLMQSRETLENLAVILAFTAVRLLQLKTITKTNSLQSAETLLSPDKLNCLAQIARRRKKVEIPEILTIEWVYNQIGKLGGWIDSKRNGQIGWSTLWKGWEKFETMYEGWEMSRVA